MNQTKCFKTLLAIAWLIAVILGVASRSAAQKRPSRRVNLAQIRGFNYVPSSARNDIKFWRDYDRAQVERELDFAQRLHLNQARVFLNYVVYKREPSAFLERVRHFVRAAHDRGVGTMVVVWDQCCSEEMHSYVANERKWYPNPGPKRLGRDFWPARNMRKTSSKPCPKNPGWSPGTS